jgi:hypothetical protein
MSNYKRKEEDALEDWGGELGSHLEEALAAQTEPLAARVGACLRRPCYADVVLPSPPWNLRVKKAGMRKAGGVISRNEKLIAIHFIVLIDL